MRSWKDDLIQNVVQGLVTMAAVSWSWNKMKNMLVDAIEALAEKWNDFKCTVTPERFSSSVCDTRNRLHDLQARISGEEITTGESMKKKKKFSFFKVLLVLGVLMAIAIYVIDKILPKPYSDEDLDDAWQTDDDLDSSESSFDSTPPPTPDMTYDVSSEDDADTKEDEAEEDNDKSKDEK
ncbi:hypothetical protein K8I28_08365 [bacterium]|nr:hypothetical protein [bacterium]